MQSLLNKSGGAYAYGALAGAWAVTLGLAVWASLVAGANADSARSFVRSSSLSPMAGRRKERRQNLNLPVLFPTPPVAIILFCAQDTPLARIVLVCLIHPA